MWLCKHDREHQGLYVNCCKGRVNKLQWALVRDTSAKSSLCLLATSQIIYTPEVYSPLTHKHRNWRGKRRKRRGKSQRQRIPAGETYPLVKVMITKSHYRAGLPWFLTFSTTTAIIHLAKLSFGLNMLSSTEYNQWH